MKTKYQWGFIIARLIAVGLLLIAITDMPRDYHIFLRYFVAGTAMWGLSLSLFELEDYRLSWIFAIISFLFLPVTGNHTSKLIWQLADLFCASMFVVSLVMHRGKEIRQGSRIEEGE